MNENQLNQYLQQADQAAEQQDWQNALFFLNQAYQLDPENSGLLTGIGTCLMNLGRASEAIPYFEKAVELAGDSPETHNNLGVVYLVCGNYQKAELSFKEALQLDDDYVQAWKNLAQVYLNQNDRLEEGLQILASIVKANPKDTEALLQLALSYEIGGDYTSARDVLERILQIEPSHPQAKQILDDINKISHDEQVRKLSSLKSLLQKETAAVAGQPKKVFKTTATPPIPSIARKTSAVIFFADDYTSFERAPALKVFYQQQNYQLSIEKSFSPEHLARYDMLIFNNPLLAGWMIDAANQCIQHEKPFALDFDIDFGSIPTDHPAYGQVGPGNQRAMQVLNILLKEARQVTVSSEVMKERYQGITASVHTALPAWDAALPGWHRPGPRHTQLHIGWMGSKADLPDLKLIRAPLQRFFNEYPESVWVSAGCDEAYDIFDDLPEDRRLFLPPPTPESVGYALSNFDILLLPLENNAYNQAKSDIPLLFAGIRKIAWIASRNRAFETWEAGGLIAHTKEEWYQHLKSLAENPSLRLQLGEEGWKKAEERKLH